MQMRVCYVCPRCRGGLALADAALACGGCGARYKLMDPAYADFAGPEISFDDWWVRTPELQRQWLEQQAPREEQFQAGVARRYSLPLLDRLGYRPGRAALLSAACGLAADV